MKFSARIPATATQNALHKFYTPDGKTKLIQVLKPDLATDTERPKGYKTEIYHPRNISVQKLESLREQDGVFIERVHARTLVERLSPLTLSEMADNLTEGSSRTVVTSEEEAENFER